MCVPSFTGSGAGAAGAAARALAGTQELAPGLNVNAGAFGFMLISFLYQDSSMEARFLICARDFHFSEWAEEVS